MGASPGLLVPVVGLLLLLALGMVVLALRSQLLERRFEERRCPACGRIVDRRNPCDCVR